MTLALQYKGFNYVSYYNGGYENATNPSTLSSLNVSNANAVALASEYGIDVDTSTVVVDPNYSDSLTAIGNTARQAVSDGYSVMMRPLIDFLDPAEIGGNSVGEWRAYFNPSSPAAFFASYETLMVNEAKVAQADGASLFCIGTEIDQLCGAPYLSYWTSIISAVRAVFHGKLTYAANWDDAVSPWAGVNGLTAGTGNLATQISFWNQLDYVGIDNYAPISDAANPTLAQLVAGWTQVPTDPTTYAVTGTQSLISYYESVAAAVGKPIIFTEMGYESASDAAEQPPYTSTNVYDPGLQANLYQAFFTAWQQSGNSSLVGNYFWNWDPNASEVGPGNGANFSPQGLPAQTVVADSYAAIPIRNDATGSATPGSIAFGNVHVGASVSQAETVTNTATASESLDASIAATGGATASGTISLLPAGASSTALTIGLTTATDGAKSGSAVIGYATDGTGIDGLPPLAIGSQTIAVTGTVYDYASASTGTATLGLIGRTTGGTVIHAASIANGTAADPFQENLVYADTGITGPFSIGNASGTIASGGTVTQGVSMAVGTAGTFADTVTIGLTSQTLAAEIGLASTMLAAKTLVLAGTVYATATASPGTTALNFGIVHVGATATKTFTVANTATGALTDTLIGGLGTIAGDFGTIAGETTLAVAAGASGTLGIALGTGTAGIFSGSASLTVASHDAALSDLALTLAPVMLTGTVDHYATADIVALSSGDSVVANGATIHLGTFTAGSAATTLALGFGNTATGQADMLGGSFSFAGSSAFTNGGTVSASGIGAGQTGGNATIALGTASTGTFTETVTLTATGSNASGYSGALTPEVVTVTGVVQPHVPTDSRDFTGSGISDVLLQNTSTDQLQEWIVANGSLSAAQAIATPSAPFELDVVGTGNVYGIGNHSDDILLQNQQTGQVHLWTMNNGALASYSQVAVAWTPALHVVGIGDLNGNGTDDLVLQNSQTGQVNEWMMNNGTLTSYTEIAMPTTGLAVAGTGDFYGNGTDDILLQNISTGAVVDWQMSNAKLAQIVQVGTLASGSSVVATGYFAGGDTSDILLQNQSAGTLTEWLMNNSTISATDSLALPSAWGFAGTGDYLGNGTSDILLQNTATRQLAYWQMNNGTIVGGASALHVLGTLAANVTPVPPNGLYFG